uniref:HIT-type domain-containing protein n=1 Tax=Amphilophus citrinellus TaxID=61819 RepID=A0A3Q0RPZ9_AMPCI
EEAKYRCPACLTHSCSLPCVKKHKDVSGCSGVRNKTAFVTLSQFDEMALLSGEQLLCLAYSLHSKQNHFATKTLFDFKLASNHVLTTFEMVSDNQTLKQILSAYIHPTESDPVTRQKLKMYVQAPFDHVKVFMKVEGRKANSVRYHELDIEKSLRDNLSYKTLIEYPVLLVVLKEHWKDYPLKGPGGRRRSTQETVSETEPPPQKKAKRGAEDEEQEEGEIIDSSDDDDDGIADKNIPCDKSCDDSKDHANDMKVIKDEVQ